MILLFRYLLYIYIVCIILLNYVLISVRESNFTLPEFEQGEQT